MKPAVRYAVLFLILGMAYSQIEIFWKGDTSLPMSFIGGAAGTVIGALERHRARHGHKFWPAYLLSLLCVLEIEYISGCILNLHLHMGLWDYSGFPLNLNGQICLLYAVLWLGLIPTAAWLNVFLRWKLFGEPAPLNFWNYYKGLADFTPNKKTRKIVSEAK